MEHARMTVAILFARRDSVYKTLPDVDVWDEERDARKWPGGCPVVAHPPCRLWSRMRHMSTADPAEKLLAEWAVDRVREWGGVLEHPNGSKLFERLPKPGCFDSFGFTMGLPQHWFGHRAEKLTLLYITGLAMADLPRYSMSLGVPPMICGGGAACSAEDAKRRHQPHPSRRRPAITKPEREHTPIEFARWLVEVARRCKI